MKQHLNTMIYGHGSVQAIRGERAKLTLRLDSDEMYRWYSQRERCSVEDTGCIGQTPRAALADLRAEYERLENFLDETDESYDLRAALDVDPDEYEPRYRIETSYDEDGGSDDTYPTIEEARAAMFASSGADEADCDTYGPEAYATECWNLGPEEGCDIASIVRDDLYPTRHFPDGQLSEYRIDDVD